MHPHKDTPSRRGEVGALPNWVGIEIKSHIMRRQRTEFQTEKQNKTPEQTLMKWSLDKCLPKSSKK